MNATRRHPLVDGYPPSWARGWGQDRHGVFVEIAVGKVRQVMRWIPGGTFWMGSPPDEAGREGWEWPRHLVELSEGFWLADTPCTQELWEEVIDDNPSRFKSPRRPVETVSWDDVQWFLQRLNERLPGLEARLPTEAQWERACRAGTDTATWSGDLEILGERNAPLLDAIAWYGGNSGVEIDLKQGYDSSTWKEKQYPHNVAGTREVRLKQPNPWGLYDMLGNVWEWCEDLYEVPPIGEMEPRKNPSGPKRGTAHVICGGSWDAIARGIRSACRDWFRLGTRVHCLGFRLACGQEPILRGAKKKPGSEGSAARGQGRSGVRRER